MSITDVLSPVRGPAVEIGDAAEQTARAADATWVRTAQSPSAVFLVRPHHFTPNPVTRADNAFQHLADGSPADVAARARAEVTALAAALRRAGVAVTVFDDASARRPDSVFPNNWITTHADGTVCLFPLYAPNRRPERRGDVLRRLRQEFVVRRVVDYSPGEEDGRFLEGTGAMVLDHVHRVAYACRSRRMDEELLAEFCRDRGYTPLVFDAVDQAGVPVYHTNVLMSIGENTAVIGADMIRDPAQRSAVLAALQDGGRQVVELEESQVRSFAGNCIELTGRDGPVLAMSATAHASLRPDHLTVLESHAHVLAQAVPTIEAAGGSVRCMIAGLHLVARHPQRIG